MYNFVKDVKVGLEKSKPLPKYQEIVLKLAEIKFIH